MTIEQALVDLEYGGWRSLSDGTAVAFYDRHLTADAVMLLPVVGVLERGAIIDSMAAAAPWASFEIAEPRVIRLGPDAYLLAYRATAQRSGEPVYRALMSTVYVRQEDEWRVAFHQQTVSSE